MTGALPAARELRRACDGRRRCFRRTPRFQSSLRHLLGRSRGLIVLALAVGFAGCGGTSKPQTVAGCLNDVHGFLVAGGDRRVSGQSPSGVTFALRIRGRRVTIDDSGNPGGARLSSQERSAIERCAAKVLG